MTNAIKPEDVHLHCRCCLNKFEGGNSINTNEMPRQLFQLFRYCTGYRKWHRGLYPEFMCYSCYQLLKSFERFEKLCKQSSCILEELLNGHKRIHQISDTSSEPPKNDVCLDTSKQSEVNLNENAVLAPIDNIKEQTTSLTKENFNYEHFDVKPEIESKNKHTDYENIDLQLEDSLGTASLDDPEVKSEASSYGAIEGEEFLSEKISCVSKTLIKSDFYCEKCGNGFKTSFKLKQHISKVHIDNSKIPLNPTSTSRGSGRKYSSERLGKNLEPIFTQDQKEKHELPVQHTDTTEPATSEPSKGIAFENVVVQPRLEDSILEEQEHSDSDFEDSLALSVLCKSTLNSKFKKSTNIRKRTSTLSSENETFGQVKLEKPKVVCDKCPRKFKWPFELRRHINEMHGDKPMELPCKFSDCGKVFNSQNTLKSHYRIKHQMKKQIYHENAYICEQCGKGFKRLPLLERHKFHHLPPEARPHKCQQCGKTFVMERIYKEHLLRHSDNKKYECSYCGIKKATIGEYREHINIHTKEKEYACESCPKIFYRPKNLAQHVSAVHQGIRKHFCRYCQHSFANHINLVHHERIHTGEKPYSCEVCNRSFIQPSALKTHMKTHDETRVKAKVGRKPKSGKPREDFDFEAIVDNNYQQQINNYNE